MARTSDTHHSMVLSGLAFLGLACSGAGGEDILPSGGDSGNTADGMGAESDPGDGGTGDGETFAPGSGGGSDILGSGGVDSQIENTGGSQVGAGGSGGGRSTGGTSTGGTGSGGVGTGGASTGGAQSTGGASTGGAGTGGAVGACSLTTIEAENMSLGGAVANQVPTAGGINIRAGDDYLYKNHTFVAESTLRVAARGEYAGGDWPRMVVTVGGTTVGDVFVETATYDDYLFELPVALSGSKEVRVTFTNDYYGGGQDRNLHVDKITLGCEDGTVIPVPDCINGETQWGTTPCGDDGVYRQSCTGGGWQDTATCVGETVDPGTIVGERVIYETDWQLDVDDVGGLAVLHGLQNEGKCTIIGVTYNEVDDDAPGAIDAVNTWYGRGTIPVGYYGSQPGGWDSDRYNYHLNHNFPHTMEDNDVGKALDIYKQVLAAQPDDSVIIVSVGFLNNLYDLLQDGEGFALVDAKVKLLAVMGGLNNDGFNFTRHGLVSQTQYVIANWPGTLVTTHAGADFYTGPNWNASNPVAKAYQLWGGSQGYQRSSWDPVTALYAVDPSWFNVSWSGSGSLTNGYSWTLTSSGSKPRGFGSPKNNGNVEVELERLMNLAPQ